ncbi:hypothetical protein AB0K67_34230 [Nonomuraea sp. NPDC052634]|uniref:hypothetical protein n=1 Tax=Nonomuraea sp. NPDC052634 TaxID=3155813 RepID=UPI0034435054
MAAVELGSINAAAYNGSPWVRAVFEHVTATVTVPEEWRRPPAPEQPARHYVRHRLFDTLAEAQAATPSDLEPLGPITLDSLPTAIAEALQSHPYDTLVGPVRDTLGWHVATATPTPPQANDPAPQATSPASETTSPAPQTNSPASETTGPAARTTGPTAFTQAATTTPPTPMSPSAPPTQTVLTSSPTRTVPATPPIQAAHTAAQPLAAVASSPSPAAEATAQPYVPEGTVQTLTRHTSRPTGPDADLLAAARRKAFARWLDDMRARKVTLVPGLEHPGDPRQPDNHHKH